MATSILLLIVVPYAVAATAYLEARRRHEAPPVWARRVGAAAVLIHLAGLMLLGRETGRSPFHTESQALSFLAFSLAAVYAVLEATSRIAAHGGGFWTLATVLAGASVRGLAGEACAASTTPPDHVMAYHMGFALLGTAALFAGGLLGAGYLQAYRRMKRDVLAAPTEEGPSLVGLQRLARDASLASLALLGPSLLLGLKIAMRDDLTGAAVVLELVVSAVQFALALLAFLVWWRSPRRGTLAASLNILATVVAIAGFTLVHPLLSKAGG